LRQRYLIALGSNQRHHRCGSPRQVLRAALAAMAAAGLTVEAAAPIMRSAPIGPSLRRYANSAALIATGLPPDELLVLLKDIERSFGRRAGGQRWSARVLDLDLVLWSGGAWSSPDLTVPHAAFRERDFVLTPAVALVPDWRDPVTNLSLRQLKARLTRPRPMPR
jgi:2-amino-4-hydroxy-6-hydroxymethyldihydropteridine diphosphokinase